MVPKAAVFLFSHLELSTDHWFNPYRPPCILMLNNPSPSLAASLWVSVQMQQPCNWLRSSCCLDYYWLTVATAALLRASLTYSRASLHPHYPYSSPTSHAGNLRLTEVKWLTIAAQQVMKPESKPNSDVWPHLPGSVVISTTAYTWSSL